MQQLTHFGLTFAIMGHQVIGAIWFIKNNWGGGLYYDFFYEMYLLFFNKCYSKSMHKYIIRDYLLLIKRIAKATSNAILCEAF